MCCCFFGAHHHKRMGSFDMHHISLILCITVLAPCIAWLVISFTYATLYHAGLEKGAMSWIIESLGPRGHRILMATTMWIMRCGIWCCYSPACSVWGVVMDREAGWRARKIQSMNEGSGPPPGGICWLGDSQFNFWNTLEQDMRVLPIPSYNAGFGGCRVMDINRALQQLCFRWNPAVVVLHVGGNDYDSGTETDAFRFIDELCELCHRILKHKSIKKIAILLTARRPIYTQEKWNFLDSVYCQVMTEIEQRVNGHAIDTRKLEHDTGDFVRVDGVHLTQGGFEKLSGAVIPKMDAIIRPIAILPHL